MSLSRKVGINTLSQLAGRLYTSTLAFVITALVLPRQLDAADFGVFAFHLTLYQLLSNVLDFGAAQIVVRDASRRREDAGRLIGMLVQLKARFALVAAVLLIAVAWVFEGPGPRFLMLAVGALHLFFHAPSGAGAIFHVDMAFGRAVLATVAGQTAWLAGTAALALLLVDRPAPYLLAYGLGPLVNGTCSYLWARRRVHVRFDASRAERRQLWHEAWPAGLSMTMASIYFYIDTAMLRPLLGEVAVAHYSVAYRLMSFVLMVPVLFSQVLLPVFSRLWAEGAERLDPVFQRSTLLLVSVGILFPATVPWVRADVIDVVYPPAYAPGADCLGILSLAIVFVFAAYPHMSLLLAAGHQRTMMWISAAGAALNVTLNLWWVPHMGIEGAAWATVATEGFVVLAAGWQATVLTGLRFHPLSLVRAGLCAAAAAAALLAVLPQLESSVARLLTGLAVGAVAVLSSGVLPLDLDSDVDSGQGPGGAAEGGMRA